MRATWTPASDSSATGRFSRRHRDALGNDDYKRWLAPDEEDVSTARLPAAVLLLAACLAALLGLAWRRLRVMRADWAARRLLAEEQPTKSQVVRDAFAAATATGAVGGVKQRFCRLCDVPVDDDHLLAHTSGKKHQRLLSKTVVDEQGRLVTGDKVPCWCWREVAPPPPPPPEAPPADAAELGREAERLRERSRPKGQPAQWETVSGKSGKKRR